MPIRRHRYQIALGELPGSWPSAAFGEVDPFMPPEAYDDLNLTVSVTGVGGGLGNGHHVANDSGFYAQLPIDRDVPLSPLFCRDLAGRVVYLGPGPEIKDNEEWAAYRLPAGAPLTETSVAIPFITFPRHCRDIPAGSPEVPEAEMLEDVLLCHFRFLEQPRGRRYWPSGESEEAEMRAVPYYGANLYPYKLRLDTFYPDGYRLPQTQMVFARGPAQGADPAYALALGESLIKAWNERPENLSYAEWFEGLGDEQRENLFTQGCSLIPTFEAFNGVAVVGRDFSLEEYWPGRAVTGLHEMAEMRADSAPIGTILEVLQPGFVTATRVVPARVVVSDGSGYVSPNAEDPAPMVPNLNLPHSRTVPNWRACHLPTLPLHFESPALFGYEPESGKFMQIMGPLWAPLYYFYGCTDAIIDAYDFPEPHAADARMVKVPEGLKSRFWPMVPLMGFDTFDTDVVETRSKQGSRLRTMIVREPTETPQAGVAYHPLPLEFEFECEPFWFPILHPLNRGYGLIPEDLAERLAPVVSPKLSQEIYIASIKGSATVIAPWLTDAAELSEPAESVIENYPGLMRYLLPNLELEQVMRWAPEPMLNNLDDRLKLPTSRWWSEQAMEGEPNPPKPDSEADLSAWASQPGAPLHAALWGMREASVTLTKFRHTLFQVNPDLYTLAYWYGATPALMQEMFMDDITATEALNEQLENGTLLANDIATPARAPSANTTLAATLAEDELSVAEQAQLQAIQQMAEARERNRLLAVQSEGTEDSTSKIMGLKSE